MADKMKKEELEQVVYEQQEQLGLMEKMLTQAQTRNAEIRIEALEGAKRPLFDANIVLGFKIGLIVGITSVSVIFGLLFLIF